MRKITGITLLSMLLFLACKRKQVDAVLDGTVVKSAAHCYDGQRNADELSVDCGGSCQPCEEAIAACYPKANTLTFEEQEYPIGAIVSKVNSNNNFEVTGKAMNADITIKLAGTSPDVTKKYTCDDGSEPLSGEVTLNINSPTLGTLRAYEGTATVTYKNGKYVITVCEAKLHSFVTGMDYTGSSIGITCN